MLACLDRLTREEDGRDALSEGDQARGSFWETEADGLRPLSGRSGVEGLAARSLEGVGGAAASVSVPPSLTSMFTGSSSVSLFVLDPVSCLVCPSVPSLRPGSAAGLSSDVPATTSGCTFGSTGERTAFFRGGPCDESTTEPILRKGELRRWPGGQ